MKEILSPNQQEDNLKARASSVTMGSSGSRRGSTERNESKPILAGKVGNSVRSEEAQKLDNFTGWNGRIRTKAGKLNWGQTQKHP